MALSVRFFPFREVTPYLPLLFPYRFTDTLAAAVDALTYGPRDPDIL